MYTFHIVKAKHNSFVRSILLACLVILLLGGFPFCIIPIFDFLKTQSDNLYILTSLGLMIVFLGVLIMYWIYSQFIGKTYFIGTAEFTDHELNIMTKEMNKQIAFKEIRIIKLKRGTGLGGYTSNTMYNTYLVSIILKAEKSINLHITNEWFKDGIKQKKNIWNKKY